MICLDVGKIAKKNNVTKGTIFHIISGRTWKKISNI